MSLIRPNHLEELAQQTGGRDRLGELLRRLIYCWLPNQLLGINFFAGDVNNFPGWDGTVRVAPQNNTTEEHRSVWQISVEKDAGTKIRRDFTSSLTSPLPPTWLRSETTYVAVTLRKLKNLEKLEQDLINTSGNLWHDVRIIDAIGLEQWIEKCQSVEAWLGEEFGLGGGQFGDSLSQRWLRWSEVTAPPISQNLVLAGREVKVVEDGLRFQNDSVLAIQTDSPEESVALIHAVIDSLPSESRNRLLYNALVVSTEAKADAYAQQPIRHEMERLTILVPPAVSSANRLARAGHKVVLAFGRNDSNARSSLIRRALRSDFEKALTNYMRISEPEATAQARACGSSVSIWRVGNLQRTTAPGDQKPMWARNDSDAAKVVPATLLRSWDEDCSGDKELIADFSGQVYERYRDSLHAYGNCDDPLYERAGSVLYVIAPAVAFTLIERWITPSHLNAFERATTAVFSKLEKATTDFWNTTPNEAPQLTEKPKYSEWLRNGLAETLLSIAFLGEAQSSNAFRLFGGGQEYVNRIIRGLPALRTDPRMIASLRDQLPYLMEAAPIPFVEALESLLQGDPLDLKPLFSDHGFFGPTFQSGLLWGLETLAWSPEYLPRIVMLLGKLDEVDPGGKIGNRPFNTLREIFLAWHPGTCASIEDRVVALENLNSKHPAVAWKVLMKLFPQIHDAASPTQQPMWRDFGRSDAPVLTNKMVAISYRRYTELALDLATDNLEKQIDLIEAYPDLPLEYQARILELLDTSSMREKNETLLARTWNSLRQLIARHRAFSDAEWALKERELKSLDEIAKKFVPVDVIARHKWVLDDQWPETGHKSDDFAGHELDIQNRRQIAIREILDQRGPIGLQALIKESRYPYIPAISLAEVLDDEFELLEILDSWARDGSSSYLSAIRAASRARFIKFEKNWTNSVLAHAESAHWSHSVIANLFLDYPSTVQTFQLIHSRGSDVEKYYWEHCWPYVSDADSESKKMVAENLVHFCRAADVLSIIHKDLPSLGVKTVINVIKETIQQINAGRMPLDRNMFSYHLGNAFKWLRKQPETNLTEVARLEYPFLPLLTGSSRKDNDKLVLHDLLAKEAEFFIQVLCDLYRPATKPQEHPIDEQSRSKATAAWRLLESWRTIPGLQEDGVIDKRELDNWIDHARSLAREKDRAEIADQQIGKLLFHAPPDPKNGSWPPASILSVIEDVESTHIDRGFELECVNSRGTTFREPLSGGTLEREIEKTWRNRARTLKSKYSRVKALFESIANNWKSQAKWHDEDAEKTRARWS